MKVYVRAPYPEKRLAELKELFEEVKSRILLLHNYEVPEIISVNINDGSKSYLDWIKENTTKKDCL